MGSRSQDELQADIGRVSAAVFQQLDSLFSNGRKAAQHQLCKEAARSLFDLTARKAHLQKAQGTAPPPQEADLPQLDSIEEQIGQCKEDLDVLGTSAVSQLCGILAALHAQLFRADLSSSGEIGLDQLVASESFESLQPEAHQEHISVRSSISEQEFRSRPAAQALEAHELLTLFQEESTEPGHGTPTSATCRLVMEQQADQLQQLHGQLTERSFELGRLQHCQVEAEASRQLIQQLTADLSAAHQQLHVQQDEQSESESFTQEQHVDAHSNGHAQHAQSHSMSSDQQAYEQYSHGTVTPGEPFSAGQAAALSALLFEKQHQMDGMEQALAAKDSQVSQLQVQLADTEAGHRHTEEELQRRAADAVLQMTQQHEDLAEAQQALAAAQQLHEQQHKVWQTEAQDLQEERGLLNVLLQQSKDQTAAMQQEHSQMDKACKDEQQRVAFAESEMARQRKHTSQVEQEAAQLALELNEARDALTAAQQAAKQQAAQAEQDLARAKGDFVAKLNRLGNENADLSAQVRTSEATVTHLQSRLHEVEADQQDTKKLAEQRGDNTRQLQQQLCKAEAAAAQLQSELDRVSDQREQAQSQLRSSKSSADELRSQLSDAEACIGHLQSQRERAHSKLSHLESSLTAQFEDTQKHEAEIQALVATNQILRDNLRSQIPRGADPFAKPAGKPAAHVMQLQNELTKRQQEVHELHTLRGELEQKVSVLTRQLSVLSQHSAESSGQHVDGKLSQSISNVSSLQGVTSRRQTEEAEVQHNSSHPDGSAAAPHENGVHAAESIQAAQPRVTHTTCTEAGHGDAGAAPRPAASDEEQQAVAPEEQALWESLAKSRQWRIEAEASLADQHAPLPEGAHDKQGLGSKLTGASCRPQSADVAASERPGAANDADMQQPADAHAEVKLKEQLVCASPATAVASHSGVEDLQKQIAEDAAKLREGRAALQALEDAMQAAREAAAQQIAATWQQHAEAEKALDARHQQLKRTGCSADWESKLG